VSSIPDDGVASVADRVEGRPVLLCEGSGHDDWPYAFALLTGRMVVESDNTSAETFATLAGASSVFLAAPPTLDTRALQALLEARRLYAPAVTLGVFYPFGSFERELFVLKAALVARHGVPAGLGHTFLYPLERHSGRFAAAGIDFVLGSEKTEQIDRILRRPAAFLYATPHSNGVNMSLGGTVLCAREDRDTTARPTARTPPCFHADLCARQQAGTNRLGASQVCSAVAFLYTCWGVLLRDGNYEVGASLGARVAASPFTAALVTTYTTSLLDRAAGLYVARMLAEGHTLGRAIADLNHRHYERYGDVRDVAVLFGDPETTLPTSDAADQEVLGHDPSFTRLATETGLRLYGDRAEEKLPGPPRMVVTPRLFASLEHSRCVASATRRLSRTELAPAADRLSESVDRVWLAGLALNGRVGRRSAAAIPTALEHEYERHLDSLHRAWIGFYTAMVTTLGGYVRLQTDRYQLDRSAAEASRTCPYCGGLVRLARTELPTGGISVRRVEDCTACGTIFDGLDPLRQGILQTPARWTAGEAVPISIRARSTGERGPVAAAALLEPFLKPTASPLACASAHWAGGDTTRELILPLPPLTPSRNLTPGVYYLNGIVMQNTGVALLRRAVTIVSSRE